MSLIGMPFVGSSADTVLHVVAAITLIIAVAAAGIGFWKLHEMPINKAHRSQHKQVGLITALTWIGFLWHWVWVLAVIVAFVDAEQALIKIRDIWKSETKAAGQDNPTMQHGNDASMIASQLHAVDK